MKNWEPLVFLPALAMERRYGSECVSSKFSSRKINKTYYRYWTQRKKKKVICHTGKFQTINGLSTGTIVVCEVSTLGHELFFIIISVKYVRVRKRSKHAFARNSKRTPGMTLWKMLPSYPNPCWPVASSRKFCVVFGTLSSKSLKTIRPEALESMATSNWAVDKEQRVVSSKQQVSFGGGHLRIH